MLRIYQAANSIDAQLLRDLLCDNDIDAIVHGSLLSGAAGELPVGTGIEIWIKRESDEYRARSIIKLFESERSQPATTVACPGCGETVEGNFSSCWNCAHPF